MLILFRLCPGSIRIHTVNKIHQFLLCRIGIGSFRPVELHRHLREADIFVHQIFKSPGAAHPVHIHPHADSSPDPVQITVVRTVCSHRPVHRLSGASLLYFGKEIIPVQSGHVQPVDRIAGSRSRRIPSCHHFQPVIVRITHKAGKDPDPEPAGRREIRVPHFVDHGCLVLIRGVVRAPHFQEIVFYDMLIHADAVILYAEPAVPFIIHPGVYDDLSALFAESGIQPPSCKDRVNGILKQFADKDSGITVQIFPCEQFQYAVLIHGQMEISRFISHTFHIFNNSIREFQSLPSFGETGKELITQNQL